MELPRDWSSFALLLIDVQNDFWSDEQSRQFPDFAQKTQNLLGFCRSEGIEVVHIRAQFSPDGSDWMVRYKLTEDIPCIEGTHGAAPLNCAIEIPGEKVFTKQTFDAFQMPDLQRYLTQQGTRFLLCAGLVTGVCVFLTSASAAQRGYLTALVTDCCADEPLKHAATLESYPFIFENVTLLQLPSAFERWSQQLRILENLSVDPV
jgi:nicotinamidase-related amidase